MSHHSSHATVTHHEGEHGHVVPVKMFAMVLGALIVLTGLTVYCAGIDFGNPEYNLIIAMLIASVKALLVVLIFMHLKYEKTTTWLYAIFPIVLLFILMGGVFIDNPLRHDPLPPKTISGQTK